MVSAPGFPQQQMNPYAPQGGMGQPGAGQPQAPGVQPMPGQMPGGGGQQPDLSQLLSQMGGPEGGAGAAPGGAPSAPSGGGAAPGGMGGNSNMTKWLGLGGASATAIGLFMFGKGRWFMKEAPAAVQEALRGAAERIGTGFQEAQQRFIATVGDLKSKFPDLDFTNPQTKTDLERQLKELKDELHGEGEFTKVEDASKRAAGKGEQGFDKGQGGLWDFDDANIPTKVADQSQKILNVKSQIAAFDDVERVTKEMLNARNTRLETIQQRTDEIAAKLDNEFKGHARLSEDGQKLVYEQKQLAAEKAAIEANDALATTTETIAETAKEHTKANIEAAAKRLEAEAAAAATPATTP